MRDALFVTGSVRRLAATAARWPVVRRRPGGNPSRRELLSRNPRLDPAAIDDVIFGCANQAGEDNRNVAHMATLLAGYPHDRAGHHD